LFAVLLLAAAVETYVCTVFYSVPAYWAMPLFFFATGAATILLLASGGRRTPHSQLVFMLGLWVGKIALSVLFVAIYVLAAGWSKPFIVIFAVFYLIYMVWETIYFVRHGSDKN
jgi:hypothetical protein